MENLAERKAVAGKGTSDKLSDVEKGQTRDIVAKLLGTSRRLYEESKTDDLELKK
jgi:hypothetical protein